MGASRTLLVRRGLHAGLGVRTSVSPDVCQVSKLHEVQFFFSATDDWRGPIGNVKATTQ